MPNNKSAKVRVKRSEKERVQNKSYKSKFKNLVKKVMKAVSTNDKETAKALLPETVSAIDKAAKIGAIHKNQASRRKSRIAQYINSEIGKATPEAE